MNASQVHPYASLARSAISAAAQVYPSPNTATTPCFVLVLMAQKNHDDRTIHLSGTMRGAFAFFEEAELLGRIKAPMKTTILLIEQVTERRCFITE